MDRRYASQYRLLYERHWWWRARERVILELLRRCGLPRGQETILDVGCGDGVFFDRLSQFGKVQGVESDPAIVDPHSRWSQAIHIGPFDDSFQPPGRYSLILMLDVIEHVPAPEAMLRKAGELLAPGGLIVLTVPALKSLWTTHDDLNKHYTRYTKQSLRAVVRAAGLSERSSRYFFAWICPLKLLIGWKERLLRSKPRPPRIPMAPLNRLFYGISRLEEAALGRLPLPLGSSLLLVATLADSPPGRADRAENLRKRRS